MIPSENEAGGNEAGEQVHDQLVVETAEALAGDVAIASVEPAASGAVASGGISDSAVLKSTALMGVGTVTSRVSGLLRDTAQKAALGLFVVADAFALGNTLPNIIYILIIGGALNAVFVPQLVRHMKDDPDGGSAFADRLLTLVGLILIVVSVAAVLLAPWIVRIYATPEYSQSDLDLATAFARFCLPQIFFYGLYTMLAQVLNARGHFGSPTFAPIVNNAVAIFTFLLFLAVAGTAAAADGDLTPSQVALLGIGTTLGVAAQALVLIPVLRRAGYRWRPRFDWRGQGLGRAGNLAAWTIGLVLVNQLAYIVVVRLATQANVNASANGGIAAGLATYQTAHLMFVLPHSIITVSLVTALLPRMSRAAHDRAWSLVAADVGSGMRTVSALIVPAAAILVVLGPTLSVLLFNWGAADRPSTLALGAVLSIFALGLLPFSLYYVILRGWYALEDTRTAFWVTVVLNAVNLVIAVPLFNYVTTNSVGGVSGVAALAISYVLSYWITLGLAWVLLSRRLGDVGVYRQHRGPRARRGFHRVRECALRRWRRDPALHGTRGGLGGVVRRAVVSLSH